MEKGLAVNEPITLSRLDRMAGPWRAPGTAQLSPGDRLLANIDVGEGCWEWRASVQSGGYGLLSVETRKLLVHRVMYEAFCGAIPDGLTIDHLCRNRRCVRPSHLEAVTMRENILRGTSPSAIHALQTHCLRGHAYDAANTHTRKPPLGSERHCLICKHRRSAERAAKRREERHRRNPQRWPNG